MILITMKSSIQPRKKGGLRAFKNNAEYRKYYKKNPKGRVKGGKSRSSNNKPYKQAITILLYLCNNVIIFLVGIISREIEYFTRCIHIYIYIYM